MKDNKTRMVIDMICHFNDDSGIDFNSLIKLLEYLPKYKFIRFDSSDRELYKHGNFITSTKNLLEYCKKLNTIKTKSKKITLMCFK